MANYAYIYKITNKVNNKHYIGLTRNREWSSRWIEHANSNSELGKAMKAYGVSSFTFEIIEEINNITFGELSKLEAKYIQKYDSINNGYNSINKIKESKNINYGEVNESISSGLVNLQTTPYFGNFEKSSNNRLSFWKRISSKEFNILGELTRDSYFTRSNSKYYASLINSFKVRKQRYFKLTISGQDYVTDNIESVIDFIRSVSSVYSIQNYNIDSDGLSYEIKGEEYNVTIKIYCVLLYDDEIVGHEELSSIFEGMS